MDNIILSIQNCDLNQIAESGQCFRWEVIGPITPAGGSYVVCDGPDQAIIGQHAAGIIIFCAKGKLNKWVRYLDAWTDYGEIIRSIPRKDKYLRTAAANGSGLRILKADLWETMVSFIISQNNNIPRIKKTVSALCKKLGECRDGVYGPYYTFPGPASLDDIRALQGLGLGYRDKYIARLARNVMDGKIDLHALRKMPTEAAHVYLKSIFGIGEKVSNCILLFGLGRKEVFPVDTWMQQVIAAEYAGKFPVERYLQTAGVMQQYMFFEARAKAGKGRVK